MFLNLNYIQLKCDDCGKITEFLPGKKYSYIECGYCNTIKNKLKQIELLEIKEKKENVKPRRKSSKTVKPIPKI